MPIQTDALASTSELMRLFMEAPVGNYLMRSRDSQDTFELQVTDHQATWFFSRRDFNFLRPDIEAAGVSYCVIGD